MRLNKKYLADILFFILLISVSLFLCLNAFLGKEKGAYAVVRVNGDIVSKFSLNDEGTYSLNDGSNILVIEKGSAYLIDADCPDKLCVNQGKIKNKGEIITCLPNRLTVTIEGGENDVDFIS